MCGTLEIDKAWQTYTVPYFLFQRGGARPFPLSVGARDDIRYSKAL